MKIYITIEDEEGKCVYESVSPTIDFAIEKLGSFERGTQV